MNDRQLLTRDLLVLFGLTGWALAIPSFASEFAVSMALTCLMYIALSTSWSLFCGSTRYLSLATSAFFGIGAYTSAIGLEQLGWMAAVLLGAGIRLFRDGRPGQALRLLESRSYPTGLVQSWYERVR